MSSDAKENPGPTIYGVGESSKIICAHFSWGNTRKFRPNTGNDEMVFDYMIYIFK